MPDAGERFGRLPADALRGAVGRDELRMLRLQVAQLPLQAIVFLVGDLRPVEDVVQPLVAADLVAKLPDALGGFLGQ
jgi:hypothetical protein